MADPRGEGGSSEAGPKAPPTAPLKTADGKRRLPVLQAKAPGAEDDEPPRPPWHWIVAGAAVAFLVWIPLAALATWLAAPRGHEPNVPLLVALHGLALALAFALAGFFVGKLRGPPGLREGTLAGLLAASAAFALGLAAPGGPGTVGWALLFVVLAGSGAGFGRLGAWLGARPRK